MPPEHEPHDSTINTLQSQETPTMNRHDAQTPRGFTLIELLITVAILAILAVIGLPNLLEAQTRAKVSRAKNDIRTLSGAIEAYAIDEKHYPIQGWIYNPEDPRLRRLGVLTTPIAYIGAVPLDPFDSAEALTHGPGDRGIYNYGVKVSDQSKYALSSDGPDRNLDYHDIRLYPGFDEKFLTDASYNFLRYDPTNGTVSEGDIIRASDYNYW
jgi:general secretion pathway protein G